MVARPLLPQRKLPHGDDLQRATPVADPQAEAVRSARHHRWAPRHAWRRGLHAAFVPWVGHVFWPYAYSDIFEYTFWPSAYEPGYWAYAYDDFVDTVFWGAESPYSAYARLGPAEPSESNGAPTGSRTRERSDVSQQEWGNCAATG